MTQKATIVDSGPREPQKPDEHATQDERDRYARDRREFEEWHKANPEPLHVEMFNVDADEATRRDPERYTKVAVVAPKVNVSLEDRVARLEIWVDAYEADLTLEDREARGKHRAGIAERVRQEQLEQVAEQKAAAVRKKDGEPDEPQPEGGPPPVEPDEPRPPEPIPTEAPSRPPVEAPIGASRGRIRTDK